MKEYPSKSTFSSVLVLQEQNEERLTALLNAVMPESVCTVTSENEKKINNCKNAHSPYKIITINTADSLQTVNKQHYCKQRSPGTMGSALKTGVCEVHASGRVLRSASLKSAPIFTDLQRQNRNSNCLHKLYPREVDM